MIISTKEPIFDPTKPDRAAHRVVLPDRKTEQQMKEWQSEENKNEMP